MVHDLDGIGVMSGGSDDRHDGADFARFGLLYLRGGEWDGTQIVPDGVGRLRPHAGPRMSPSTAPTGGSPERQNAYPDCVPANGFNGQSITIVPELDLVVVVLANEGGARPDLVGRPYRPGVR